MPGENSNKEFEQKTSGEQFHEKSPLSTPQEQPKRRVSFADLDRADREAAAQEEVDVREELKSFPGDKGREKTDLEKGYEKAYERTRELVLDVLNERVVKPRGKEPLTVQQIATTEGYKLSAFFNDQETGQKWRIMLDRGQMLVDEDSLEPVVRIRIFDHSPRGKRILSEWKYEDMPEGGWPKGDPQPRMAKEKEEQYGDVYDVGWRIDPNGIINYDSRRNFDPHIPLLREASEGIRGMDIEGLKRINTLLERTLRHPELVKSSSHKASLPRIPQS